MLHILDAKADTKVMQKFIFAKHLTIILKIIVKIICRLNYSFYKNKSLRLLIIFTIQFFK